ncbi:MAG TPA: MarR family transcriptional regulator [Herpetosiphonaceae bacterium]
MSWTIEEATQELLGVLPLLSRIVAAEVRREAGEETTMPQFRVLSYLASAPLTLSVLAKKRRVTLQSMSELVQMLVERGWIARLPDPHDRRQHLLCLTDEGRRHYEHAQEYTLRRLAPLMQALSPTEMDAVRVALPALRRVLTQEEGQACSGG